MAEWSIAAVLKTVEGNTSVGSNPTLSAKDSYMFSIIDYLLYCSVLKLGLGNAEPWQTSPPVSRVMITK